MKTYLAHIIAVASVCTVAYAQPNPQVLAQFEAIASNNPASSLAQFNIGQYHFFTNNFTSASTLFDKAVALDTQEPDFFFFQAAAYEGQGQYEQALNAYDKAISLLPATEYQMRRAWLRYKLKKYTGAAQDFKAILEDYESMSDLKKAIQDCEKAGGAGVANKPTETNATTEKVAAETPAAFVDRFIKQFERFSDAGELYRGIQALSNGNIDKALPVFTEVTTKDQDAEAYFFTGLAHELKNNNTEALNSYQKAERKVEMELIESKFEQLAGSPSAAGEVTRLTNLQTDYRFKISQLASKTGNTTPLAYDMNINEFRDELRSANNTYVFYIVKQNDTEYQLDIKNKRGDKVMLARIRVTTEADGYSIKIIHGGKKDASGLTWELFPNDYFTTKFNGQGVSYSHIGSRLDAVKNTQIDFANVATIKPTTNNLRQALEYAARAYMVGFIVKE